MHLLEMYVGKLEKWGGKREKFIFALESNKEKRVFKKFPATAAGGLYAIIIIMHSICTLALTLHHMHYMLVLS